MHLRALFLLFNAFHYNIGFFDRKLRHLPVPFLSIVSTAGNIPNNLAGFRASILK